MWFHFISVINRNIIKCPILHWTSSQEVCSLYIFHDSFSISLSIYQLTMNKAQKYNLTCYPFIHSNYIFAYLSTYIYLHIIHTYRAFNICSLEIFLKNIMYDATRKTTINSLKKVVIPGHKVFVLEINTRSK